MQVSKNCTTEQLVLISSPVDVLGRIEATDNCHDFLCPFRACCLEDLAPHNPGVVNLHLRRVNFICEALLGCRIVIPWLWNDQSSERYYRDKIYRHVLASSLCLGC